MNDHRCGFDFESVNQPWAECTCGAIATNPMFVNWGIHLHIGKEDKK